MKINNNFLVVSNYNNDISWIRNYTENYFIYDKSDAGNYAKGFDKEKTAKSKNVGYNIGDYCSFIVDNYDSLPECTIFTKGNVFPRHVSQEYFDKIVNNQYFTPIEDYRMHKVNWPTSFFSSNGGFCEINNSWYLKHHPTKYFHDYNDFLKFCFKNPVIPRYIRFAPGANYIVPKQNILKLPKIFYQNLKNFVSHDQLAGEAHIIERALHTLWTSNFEMSDNMLKPISKDFSTITLGDKNSALTSIVDRLKSKLKVS